MANEIKKVKIKSISSNDKFFNIVGEDDIQYGIGKEKSPKLSAILSTAKEGDEITAEYNAWQGKHYLSDVKDSSAKKGAPRDKNLDGAIAAAQAVGSMYMTKGFTKEAFDTAFDHVYKRIIEKVTKPAEEVKK